MITGLHHINLTVPTGTLDEANAFYAATLGLTPRPVPAAQAGRLAWFDIISASASSPESQPQPLQQVHIAFGNPRDFEHLESTRHPCFRVGSPESLLQLQQRVHEHFQRGGPGAPLAADKPGEENSGAKGAEYPTRFFARDYAGNRLEFTL
ncbi:glyoxalase family protein [Microdochium bolleyi]|uniref:Glyoxalase family protein n=1 Tax=Microdochium bolleyi TaxID=196109 RepID=A0A136INM4_9PEZI|nr:glyoxalase family protein [Microdochium bolleyi]